MLKTRLLGIQTAKTIRRHTVDKDDRLTITLKKGEEIISLETSADISEFELKNTVIRLRHSLTGDKLSNHFDANKETIKNFSDFNNDYVVHYS
mgnify:FL=1|tara:strand:+ start:309 stop:587 length:279 start_codon:yes stop_codon:yes gene_type:complete